MKKLFLTVIILLISLSLQAKDKTYTVLFKTGEYSISKPAEQYLDSLVYHEIILPGVSISIVGYADYVGDSSANMVLSQKRAEAVKTYLVSLGIKESDMETVQWKGELPANDSASADGVPYDRRVDIVVKRSAAPVTATTTSKYKVNDVFRLNVLFKATSHQYLQISIPVLDSFYRLMAINRNLKVSIEGHICCGSGNSNPSEDGYDMDTQKMGLSTNRAKAVYDYMVQKGIDPKWMSYKGFGFCHPLYPAERTQEERDLNKRVEIRIVGS